MRKFCSFFFISIFLFCFSITSYASGLDSYASLKTKYENGGPIRVLLVPGHDNEFSGANYGGVREADMNLKLAKMINGYLSQDPNIQVTMARDDNGYNPDFLAYYNQNSSRIMQNVANQSALINEAIQNGEIQIPDQVPHADATTTVVDELYTLNSWIDTKGFDLVLHIHFNDYGGRYADKTGKYSGFSVYVPDQRLINATTSQFFGDSIAKRLSATLYKSNDPAEKAGTDKAGAIPDFYLIAMGSYNSVSTPRALVEYSYIYEPQLQNDFFNVTANVLARGTVAGVQDFLNGKKVAGKTNLDYFWQNNLSSIYKKASSQVLALQYGLSELGFYPAKGLPRSSCPFSGVFGPCTTKALSAFQASQGLKQTGVTGPVTRQTLNNLFPDN